MDEPGRIETMEASVDRDLVARMLSGDQRAFDEFFHGYFDRLYRFALVRLDNDPDTAEDIVQQTLCRAVERLGSFRGEAALFTWLCQICRNMIADTFRAKERPRGVVVPFDDTEEIRAALESIAALPAEDPQQSLMNEQLQHVVQVVLDYLPRRYGEALEWKYIQGLSIKEIAARLEIAPKAAESVLSRARAAFRQGFASIASAEALAEQMGEQP
jgi:RNA polymerase sigma-70 factor, ECF subfamily